MTCTLFCFDVRIAPNHRLSILLVLLSFFVVGQVIQTYGQDTKPVCVPRDYWLSSSTDCNETLHERTVVYSLRDASHDRCVGPQKIVIEGHTCECTLFEYEAIRQDDEENSLRIKDFIPIASGCVSNPPVAKILHDTIDDESWLPSVCGLEDIGSHYTECNSSTNMRLLVFYWKRLCRRTGTIALPSTTDLPCNAMCSDGQFLAPPFTECQTCPSGTYSITGTIYSYPWNDLPDGFHTDCFGSNCKVWSVQGDSLTVTGGSTARLRMWYDVIQFPAYLNVTYIGSRDLKDLNILINGEVTYPTKKSIPDPDWSLMSIDLSSQAEGECHIFLKIESEYDELQELCLARNDFVPGSSQTHLPPVQRMSEVEVVAASNLGCNARDFRSAVRGRVVVILRGKCRFDEKTRNAQAAGAIAVIHVDNGGATWSRLRITGDSAGLNIPILVTQVKDPHKIFSALHEKSVHMGSFARHVERLGRTEVEFIFTGSPADSIHIREISVKGTANAASQCRLCPPGFSSESGSAKCVPCPANTYADTWGTMWPCKNCPDHATSSQGSLVCTERSRCDISDVDVQLSSCALSSDGDFTRRLIYERRKPLSCDSSTWVAPDLKEVPCSQCPLGFQYDGTQCTGCPAGEYLDSRLGSCKKCGRGKYAQKVIRYEGFADLGGTLPPDWTVTCTFCTEPSWQFIPQSEENHARIHLMTGPHFGVLGYGKLSIPFQLEVTGRIAFAYHVGYDMHMSHAPKTVNISFSISDNRTHISKNIHRAPNGITQYETYALPAGEYKLEFTYMRIESDMTDVTLTLHSLNIEGIYEGSAHECVPCPSGVMCENGIPTPCAVGTYSRVGGHCEVCEENAIAPDIGTSSCHLCGEGTHADASHQTCFLDPYVILQSADGDIPVHFSLIDATSVTAPVPIKSVSGAKRTEHEGESVILHLRTAAKKEENDGGISPCEGASGDGPFACLLMPEESKKEPRVLGKSLLSVSMERDPRNIDNAVVKLQLGDGDICNREENIYYQTAVYLGCTPFSRTDQVGIPLQIIGWEGCSISVLMEAPSLCPLCTSFQTQEEIGECISGKRLVYRTKRQTCYDLQAKKVVVFGGDAPLELPCDLLDDLEAHAALVKTTVIICVIAFCFLIGIAAYLYISRKRMYGAYMKLAASAGDACSTPTALELEDVDEQEK